MQRLMASVTKFLQNHVLEIRISINAMAAVGQVGSLGKDSRSLLKSMHCMGWESNPKGMALVLKDTPSPKEETVRHRTFMSHPDPHTSHANMTCTQHQTRSQQHLWETRQDAAHLLRPC